MPTTIDPSLKTFISDWGDENSTLNLTDLFIGETDDPTDFIVTFQTIINELVKQLKNNQLQYGVPFLDDTNHIPTEYNSIHQTTGGNSVHFSGSDPTPQTQGNVGDIYLNTNNAQLSQLTDKPTPTTYNWVLKYDFYKLRNSKISTTKPTDSTSGIENDIIFYIENSKLKSVFNLRTITGGNYIWDEYVINETTTVTETHENNITDKFSNGYYADEEGTGRLASLSSMDSHLYKFGENDFSFTFIFNFSPDTANEEQILFSTLQFRGTTLYSKGIALALTTQNKLKLYINDTDSRSFSQMWTSNETSPIFGKGALVGISIDRTNHTFKLFVNDKKVVDQTLSGVGDIDGEGLYVLHAHSRLDIASEAKPAKDISIHSMAIWNRYISIDDMRYLLQTKNHPKPSEQFAQIVYQSDFSSDVDGWTHGTNTTLQAVSDNLQIRASNEINGPKTVISEKYVDIGEVYHLEFELRSIPGYNNTKVNGFQIYIGSIAPDPPGGTSPDPGVGQRIITVFGGLPTEFKKYSKTFRVSPPVDILEDTGKQYVAVWLTHNNTQRFGGAQNDGFQIRNIIIRKVGCIEHFGGQNMTHSRWLPDYYDHNIIENEDERTRLFIDRIDDHGEWSDDIKLQRGNQTSGFTIAEKYGFYRVEGNMVYIEGRIQCSSVPTNSLGQINIGGLPFRSHDRGSSTAILNTLIKNVANNVKVHLEIPTNSDTILFQKETTNSYTEVTATDLRNDLIVRFSGWYSL